MLHKLLCSGRGVYVEQAKHTDAKYERDFNDNNWYYFKEPIGMGGFKDFDYLKSYPTKIVKSRYNKLNGRWIIFDDDKIEIIDE